ncbi:uncharacterized protein G2W53_030893 [Senna tora]|uniref:Uncharacterized protein n=1 Tax=Senna tora TaxID=362788 RepID=A0A834T7A6_9FABA|nr:uncharacterized protein G2W53_030893 [Senna tora]
MDDTHLTVKAAAAYSTTRSRT